MAKMIRTQVRLPAPVAEWVKQKAEREGRSMNSQIVHYLKWAMQSEQRAQK